MIYMTMAPILYKKKISTNIYSMHLGYFTANNNHFNHEA